MKKTAIGLIVAVSVIGLFGCERFNKVRGNAQTQVRNTTEGLQELGGKIRKTKENVEETIQNAENAAREIGEAVDTVKKIGQ